MTALDYILEGLAQALEVERELGVKTIEIDRALLTPPERKTPERKTPEPEEPTVVPAAQTPAEKPAGQTPAKPTERPAAQPVKFVNSGAPLYDYIFLHDRPLTPAGVEMMNKIVKALGQTPECAPVIDKSTVPSARIYVVLGARALAKYFPGVHGEPGAHLTTPSGHEILITYSPAYILRFAELTPAVRAIKQNMWTSLKTLKQHLNLKGTNP